MSTLHRLVTVNSLWHGLHNALPRHPFLWYELDDTLPAIPRELTEPPLWQQALLYLTLTVMSLIGFLVWASLTFPMEVILLVTGLVTGGYAATSIAGLITRERERGRYELMGLSPSGLLGASWVMATRFLRRSERFDNLRQLVNIAHTLWLFVLVPLFLINFLVAARSGGYRPVVADFGPDFSPFVNALILLIVSRGDFMYSVVVGAVLGMITPTFTRSRNEAYSYTLILFILQQLVVYILLIVITALISALLNTFFYDVQWYWHSLAWLLTFFVIREAEMRGICAILAWRVNVNPDEVIKIYTYSI